MAGTGDGEQSQGEVHIWRLLVDAGIVEALAHVDPEGCVAQPGCRRVDAGSLAGPEKGTAAG